MELWSLYRDDSPVLRFKVFFVIVPCECTQKTIKNYTALFVTGEISLTTMHYRTMCAYMCLKYVSASLGLSCVAEIICLEYNHISSLTVI